MKGYLDIETSFAGEITVIGLYRPDQGFVQLVGEGVSPGNLLAMVQGLNTLCTYNGSRFDLPVIWRRLGIYLPQHCLSHDLMYDCWRHNLYGGLKRVEQQLGIARSTQGIDGWEAMCLWERYQLWGNREALETLLRYNREDVLNLLLLEERLRDLSLG